VYFTIGSVRSPPHTLWGREPQSLIVVGLRKRILRILGTNYSFLRASQNRECRPMRLSWSSGQPSPRLLTAFTVLSRSRPPNPARLHRVWAGGKTFTLQERAGKKFSLSRFAKFSLSHHISLSGTRTQERPERPGASFLLRPSFAHGPRFGRRCLRTAASCFVLRAACGRAQVRCHDRHSAFTWCGRDSHLRRAAGFLGVQLLSLSSGRLMSSWKGLSGAAG
jgi:hypothetical protein